MYLDYFNFSELPFTLTPNTNYFYKFTSHQQAFNVLSIALKHGEGFIKVTGEVGTGKTLLCRKLLNTLDKNTVTIYIPNPSLTPTGLHIAVAEELGVIDEENTGQHHLLKLINEKLIEINKKNKKVVLLLDEAQSLPEDSLETLRLLTNLETETSKLLHVVLFGQPELDKRLNLNSLRQLKQRITFSYHLRSLDKQGLEGYISHRLQIAGYNGLPLFNKGALKATFKLSGGIPRLVNILCHKALLSAYGHGDKVITGHHIKIAAQDTDYLKDGDSSNPFMMTILGLGMSAVAGFGLVYFVM
ncbi:MAG: AAA family ATPase [Methylococcales bacterium]|jgi:MSHA biogenesis protein MshM|nr:AAA family ATPase [Methylococcales bacterium]